MAGNLAGTAWPAVLAAAAFVALAVAGLAVALFKLEFGKAARRRRRLRTALARPAWSPCESGWSSAWPNRAKRPHIWRNLAQSGVRYACRERNGRPPV